ncbi:MAG: AmmeMemoRadiSam system protein B [Magnetococcales bacterium]|nr:AmmeMemoRadiSam system protein B [Magnetococcales bacterium]
MKHRIREPAVAGTFYPRDPRSLRAMIRSLLDQVAPPSGDEPLALIVPHAGYVYSGPTAAHGYRHLRPAVAGTPRRVFVLAPSHRVALEGISVGNYHAYGTPLGTVPVDGETVERLAGFPDVSTDPASHIREHALEVHLPFLQETLVHFLLVPIIIGDISGGHLADLLSRVWTVRDLLIVSSDLSHYYPYEEAVRLDARSHEAVLSGSPRLMAGCLACGVTGMTALLELGRRQRWQARLLDYRNSGDTAGDRSRVVGYASYAFYSKGNAIIGHNEETGNMEADVAEGSATFPDDLPRLARRHLEGVLDGKPGVVDREAWIQTHAALGERGACFVTLTRKGRLRGCIGSLEAHRGLLDDLLDNAVAAALRDTRFRPLARAELDEVSVEVSLLTPPVALDYVGTEDLLRQLQPGVHGVILSQAGRRATFLPQVWEQLPDPVTFLTHLCQKAGLPGDCWRHHPGIHRYTVRKIQESGL